MDEFTWVCHAETGGTWKCPTSVLDEMAEKGWEPCDPPEEPNPVVAERIAWERQQAEQAAAAEAETTKPTKAARRGTSEEMSDG